LKRHGGPIVGVVGRRARVVRLKDRCGMHHGAGARRTQRPAHHVAHGVEVDLAGVNAQRRQRSKRPHFDIVEQPYDRVAMRCRALDAIRDSPHQDHSPTNSACHRDPAYEASVSGRS
jgi:hypothetical protein